MTKKYFWGFFLILICFSFIPISYADECDSESLKKMAELVDVQTEFDYDSVQNGFSSRNIITVTGLTSEIYAMVPDHSTGFFYEESVEGAVSKVIEDSSIDQIGIYSVECPDVRLRTVDLSLLKYNFYSEYDECEDLEDKLDVCSKFYDKDISYEQFLKAIDDYKKQNSNGLENIVDNKYNFVLIAFVLIIVVVGVIFIVYRNKKNRLD